LKIEHWSLNIYEPIVIATIELLLRRLASGEIHRSIIPCLREAVRQVIINL
jgi:hypothetical protein